jgi:hypothetical protein
MFQLTGQKEKRKREKRKGTKKKNQDPIATKQHHGIEHTK